MDIVHVDPGYGKGYTGADLTCVESEEYNPDNGVAFTANGGVGAIPIPDSFYSSTMYNRVLSCRFSAYLDLNSSSEFIVGLRNSKGTTFCNYVKFTSSKCECLYGISSSIRTMTVSESPTKGLHNFVISICLEALSSDVTPYYGYIYMDFDGETKNAIWGSSTSNVDQILGLRKIYFSFPNSETNICYVSNVIVATATGTADPILTSETKLVRLPLSTPPTGDFLSVGDGEYVGNTAGQKLLQTINASDAITKYGATSKVSHLVTYGAPGYRVGSNIETAYGISEEDGTITQQGSCSLSTDTNGSAVVAWETPSTTLNDVDGLKVGWQV